MLRTFVFQKNLNQLTMKVLAVLSAVIACAFANPGVVGYSSVIPAALPAAYAAAPALPAAVAASPVAYSVAAPAVVPAVTKTQYHAQDELGQASYGHTEPLQAHHAVRDAYGNVAGSYAYINPAGQEIRVNYIADHAGFRAASNALPVPVAAVQDTPEVVAARAAHLAAVAQVHARAKRSPGVLAAAPLAYSAVTAHSPLALAAPAPVAAYAAPAPVAAVAAPLARNALLTTIVNNPGHAVSYRVD